jgi:hypothetical protein
MKKSLNLLLLLFVVLLSCEKEGDLEKGPVVKKEKINGYVQKG